VLDDPACLRPELLVRAVPRMSWAHLRPGRFQPLDAEVEVILCNPCNPVGRVYTQAELRPGQRGVVERQNGGRVFADEIHAR